MSERQEVIERLQALKLEGGSHEMLSAICRAVAPGAKYGWTQGACDGLRLRLISFLSETDEEALREAYTKGREDGMGMANRADMRAEYLRGKNDGYDEGWDAGFASADDWLAEHEDAMAEHGWVKLPKDADGEYIHVGDVMEGVDKYNSLREVTGRVTTVTFEADGLIEVAVQARNDDGKTWRRAYLDPCASLYRHHHEPTVEDVLRDYGSRILIADCIDEEDTLVAEYADKLRLAGDAE